MAGPFETLVSNLSGLGFFGFLLPFILVFTIVYALLLKSKALGDDKKIAGVIGLVLGFFVVGFGGPVLGAFFTGMFGAMAVVLAGILMILLFVALAGGDVSKLGSNKMIAAILAVIGIVIFASMLSVFGVGMNNSLVAVVLVIAVMVAAIAFVTK